MAEQQVGKRPKKTKQEVALDFLGGYLIELSLSVDNLFVFLSIFTSFGVPEQLRHRGCIGFYCRELWQCSEVR